MKDRKDIDHLDEVLNERPEAARAWLASVKVEMQIEALAEKIRKTEGKTPRAELEAELKKLLDTAFDFRLKKREAELEMLKEEVKEIEAMIEKRKSNKQKIIDRHFLELVSPDDDDEELAW